MRTLAVAPEGSAYTVVDGTEVIQNKLDGGRSRFRLDILKSSKTVTVQWILDPIEYSWINAFYRDSVKNASTPFLMELVVDEGTLTTHECYFIPGTKQLVAQAGLAYTVSANLEVKPVEYDPDTDDLFIALGEEFGPGNVPYVTGIVDNIINFEFPSYLVP